MRVRTRKQLSCLLLLALLLSVLPGAAWAEGIEELDLEPVEITDTGDTADDEGVVSVEPEGDDPAVFEIDGEQDSDGSAAQDDAAPPPAEADPEESPADGEPVAEPAPEEPDEPAAGDPESADGETGGVKALESVSKAVVSRDMKVRLYAQLAVDENFRVNLLIALPADADPTQYRVRTVFEAQMSERIIDRTLSAEDKEDELYVIADIAQARIYQLTAPIEITVFFGSTELRHELYCVRDYLEKLAAQSEAHEAFCVAALCYGGAAQRWLDGRSFQWEDKEYKYEVFKDDPADADLRVPDPPFPLPDPSRPARETVYTDEIDDMGNLAARFQIGLETALRFYFSYPQNPSALVFTAGGHSFSAPGAQAASFWYVDLPGIKASELANDFAVDVSGNGQKMSILYSPYCYAAQHWNSNEAKLSELCRMMVAFGNEAAALAAALKE